MAELKKIRRYYTPGYFTPRLFASGGQAGGYGYYYGNNAGIGNTGSNVSGGASGGGSFMSNFGSNFGSIGSAAMGTIGQWTDAADINAEQQIGTQSLEDIRNAKSKDQLYGNSIDASTIHFKRPGLGASLMEGTMYGVQGGTAISPG
ncbi:MAG: hypothetical protein LBE56_12750 [Tannerella sp.]|jgi:hypothetical protein|nr:hypothetical protein [Tannerella sp.]